MDITYNDIKNYLIKNDINGNEVCCIFKIENETFTIVEKIVSSNNKLLVNNLVKKSGVGLMRNVLNSIFKNTENPSNEDEIIKYSQADIELTIVKAFEGIMKYLVYDRNNHRWRIGKSISKFEEIIKKNPIEDTQDIKVLSRMLVEMARADGKIDVKERLFFEEFLMNQHVNLGELIRAPYISSDDVFNLTEDKRTVIYLIVAAVALTDFNLHEKEREKLSKFGKLLNISEVNQKTNLKIAQDYILRNYLHSVDEVLSYDSVQFYGERLNMDVGQIREIYNLFYT